MELYNVALVAFLSSGRIDQTRQVSIKASYDEIDKRAVLRASQSLLEYADELLVIVSNVNQKGSIQTSQAAKAEKFVGDYLLDLMKCDHKIKFKTAYKEIEISNKWVSDIDAYNRMKVKLEQIKPTFDDLSEDEYGDWINSLEFDEFLELMEMCDEIKVEEQKNKSE